MKLVCVRGIMIAGSRRKLWATLCSRGQERRSLQKRLSSSSSSSRVKAQDPKTTRSSSFLSNNSTTSYQHAIPIALVSMGIGFLAGRQSFIQEEEQPHLVLPNGLPRTCCDHPKQPLTEPQKALFRTLRRIVGKQNVLDGAVETTETSQFLKGARLGRGHAAYIVKPQKLKQILEIVQATIDADCTVLVQGQNTGLTGGSVPRGQDRPTVIISMKDLNTMFPIDGGQRVVCLGGAGLASLQQFVEGNFPNRESHSILGSTFLNPTTAAGVAFGSGGTQCRKGPAFTERALYLKVAIDKFGTPVLKVVNTLGVKGFDREEGEFTSHLSHDGVIPLLDSYVVAVKGGHPNGRMKTSNDGTYGNAPASDVDYKNRLCQFDSGISRYNADTSGCDCNRSEGKVLILASVHDTFPKPTTSKTYWVSLDSLETTLQFRRQVCLDNPADLPVSMEYMDRDSFDVIDRSGRVLGNTIKLVGSSSPVVRSLWNVKLWIEALEIRGASTFVDSLLHFVNPIAPAILPSSIIELGRSMDHHIAMTVGDFDGSLDRFLKRLEDFQKEHGNKIVVQDCTSQKASLDAFRFVAAPAFRTWCVGEGVQGFSVDYALPKNGGQAPPLLSSDATAPLKRMRYSHFGCNVVHEDLAYAPGVDIHAVKRQLKQSVEHDCGGKLPAEHGHGTEYHAPEKTRKRWKNMDPLNVMNPGIGGLSTKYRYQ